MSIDPTIFRAYDIRGIVDQDLTEEAVERIGAAFAVFAHRRGGRAVSVGRDCRLHSPRLAARLMAGLRQGGIDVIELGTVSSPMQYFSLHHCQVDGGIMITGSHNPPEYNGLKISWGQSTLHGDDIQELRAIATEPLHPAPEMGRLTSLDITAAYQKTVLDHLRPGPRRLKIVADAGNGTAGPSIVPLLEALGHDVVPLYCEMDGAFPNHHPDPTVEENLRDLQAAVRAHQADFGVAFDGDADRLGVVDEQSNIIWGDRLMIIFARAVLAEVPGATIIGEVKCSQTLYDAIAAAGGTPLMWKTGHSLIKAKMKESGALLAGEMSGHIFFAHRWLGFDDGVYAALRLAEILSQHPGPLSALLSDVPEPYNTPEIRRPCPEHLKFALVDAAVAHFSAQFRCDATDGVRILLDDGWALVRASNTQPILVLRFEASTPERLAAIRHRIEEDLSRLEATLLATD